MQRRIHVADQAVGGGGPLVLIAGPCVIETEEGLHRIAAALQAICASAGVPLIFKASFDKANRTSLQSYRGPGLHDGLEMLGRVKERFGLPITTDVHAPEQASAVAKVADLLQVPALLCRQTDLLVACGATGKPVNLKKGQFMAPWDLKHAIGKVGATGSKAGVMVTERGMTFGYGDLVSDMRSLVELRKLGVPVCYDATHSVQKPSARGDHSGGSREYIAPLARAATAVGIDCLFAEVHTDPSQALSDAETQLPLVELPGLLAQVTALHALQTQ